MNIGDRNIKIEPSEFKGKWYVSIREWYTTDDGKTLPGKRGINLTIDEWNEFIEKLDDIKNEITEAMK